MAHEEAKTMSKGWYFKGDTTYKLIEREGVKTVSKVWCLGEQGVVLQRTTPHTP